MKNNQQHHFFLHDPSLKNVIPIIGTEIILGPELSMRIATILRLRPREFCTLFYKSLALKIELTSISPGKGAKVSGRICEITEHAPLTPEITLVCGATKQATFEEICYTAAQLGVTNIFPITTQKSYVKTYSPKDLIKFNAQAIAAAEQSKQIILPIIHEPVSLEALLKTRLSSCASTKIIFETDGTPLRSWFTQGKPTHTTIACGPEGGFTPEECALLEQNNFKKMQLCKPVLRTQDAVEVALGFIRCLF